MSDLKPAETIALCMKCGRGFVWIPDGHPMIDPYPDQKAPRGTTEPCGGEIKMLTAPLRAS